MEAIKNYLVKFIKSRNVGFFMLLAICVLSLAVSIVYTIGFTGSARYSALGAFFPLLTFMCLLLTLYKPVERYASILTNVVCIFGLLFFLQGSYWHFGDSFFAVKDDMPTNIFVLIGMLGFPYAFSLLSLVFNLLLSFVTMFVPVSKKLKEKEVLNGGEN